MVHSSATARSGPLGAGTVVRVPVPEAIGGKTVIGQLAVDLARERGFVTAYGCDHGVPRNPDGKVSRADLNFDGRLSAVWSNRLIVEADDDGDVCLYTSAAVAMIVDVNAVSFDTGVTSFANRRTDTRTGAPVVAAGVLQLSVPEAVGGKTVIGQIAVDHATEPGYVTAYACDRGLPTDPDAAISRADLNYDGRIAEVWSNRLIVQADAGGNICLYTRATVDMVVDINGVADAGVTSFTNRRTDTRRSGTPLPAKGVLRVSVPEAVGGQTVIGQVAVDHAEQAGFVTAYGCDDGLPSAANGTITRADLNYNGSVSPVWSNRLIVQADDDGEICLFTLAPVDMIVDVNGVASAAAIQSFPNLRTDTRIGTVLTSRDIPIDGRGVPLWPPYTPRPALDGVAALTGEPATAEVARRPILALKIDNYRRARPQFGLDAADAVIELNVEGVTRFLALYQTRLPNPLGPVRSARTADLDLLAAMNRPIFGYSGANPGVTDWVTSAANSGLLVDFTAQRRPCFSREPTRPGPHNLLIEPTCVLATAPNAGAAAPLWAIDASWTVPAGVATSPDATFIVPMDGIAVTWTWHAATASYLRTQDDAPHLAQSGRRISARNVVEISTLHVPSTVDARSPNPVTVGSGDAVVHRDGLAIPATWFRASPYDGFRFFAANTGTEIPLDTGTTYLEVERDR